MNVLQTRITLVAFDSKCLSVDTNFLYVVFSTESRSGGGVGCSGKAAKKGREEVCTD